MTEPKTLREYLNRPVTADEAETEGRWDRIMIKQNDPILDAHIIRGTSADAPVWVIAPEALDAARHIVTAWIRRFSRDDEEQHQKNIDEVTAAILQALLPGARRAKAVLEGAAIITEPCPEVGESGGELAAIEFKPESGPLAEEYDPPLAQGAPVVIAILHNEQEKE